MSYQYFLHVVPTTYIAPRSSPLHTNQYSVTHYTRVLNHNSAIPGIFFKFEMDPMHLTMHQRTTTFVQLMIRYVFFDRLLSLSFPIFFFRCILIPSAPSSSYR